MSFTRMLQLNAAAVLVSVLAPTRADACVCVEMGTPNPEQIRKGIEQTLSLAEAVFSGEIISADTLGANLKVGKVWKGSPGGIARLQHAYLTSTGSAVWNTCDYTFEVGEKYVSSRFLATPARSRPRSAAQPRRWTQRNQQFESWTIWPGGNADARRGLSQAAGAATAFSRSM